MAESKISMQGLKELTNGNIDTSKYKAILLSLQDAAISSRKVTAIIPSLSDVSIAIGYLDNNASYVYNIVGKGYISNGTLTLSDFQRAMTGSSSMSSVSSPIILGIYGII